MISNSTIRSEEIQNTIKQILIDELQVNPSLIRDATADTTLLGRGVGLDSVEAMRLALGLENAYDISIPDADLTVDLFSSLGNLAAYVQSKIGSQEKVAS